MDSRSMPRFAVAHGHARKSGGPLRFRSWALRVSALVASGLLLASSQGQVVTRADTQRSELSVNPSGFAATLSTAGRIDRRSAFFQPLGSNGRTCASCHVQSEGWSITPAGSKARFEASGGLDPLFRAIDAAVNPHGDVSTVEARRSAYRLVLTKGLIRVGLPIPPGSEFELIATDDPYGHASAAELSLFRRPLPSTNLAFVNSVMWDGRETFADPTSTRCIWNTSTCFASLQVDLLDQANAAVVGHAQGVALTSLQRQDIVDFETSLFTAQVIDGRAGPLDGHGAHGGTLALSQQTSYFGINDTLAGDYRGRAAFDPNAMSIFAPWSLVPAPSSGPTSFVDAAALRRRQSIARGELLFNSKPIAITGVKGLNDALGMPVIAGTCTTCHNTPNAGNHSVPLPLDIGISDGARRTPDLPLYTLRNKATGDVVQTTDPGRALITGRWSDIGRFKGPVLRALAARAPYFHNGFAADLEAVVRFYESRFGIQFTPQERQDLVAFLQAL